MLSAVLGLVTKFKAYLIAGAAVIALAAGSYGAGYLKGENHVHAQDVKVAVAQGDQKTVAVVKAANEDQAAEAAQKVRDLARERQFQATVDALQSQKDTLQRTLNAKTDPDPDCRVALGDVRMLDDAGTAGSGGGSAPQPADPAVVAAYQEQAPSAVTCRALVSDEITVREQYGELAARHDGLVDWVQKELIDPQAAAVDKK